MKPFSQPLPLLVLLLWCLTGLAQTAEPNSAAPVPIENFFRNPDVLDAQLSPSGQLLALTTAVGAKRVALVVVDLDTPGKVNRVALFSDIDVVRFNWVNNKRLVFSVADLETGSGEDRYTAPGLFSVDAQGQDLRRLVALRPGPLVTEAARFSRDALP